MNKYISMVVALVMSIGLVSDLSAQQERGERGKRGAQRDRAPQADGDGQGRRGGASGELLFKRFDSNQDGNISQAEAPDRMKQRFESIDANSDGVVSQAELASALQNMGGGKGGGGKGQGKKGRGKGKEGKGKGRGQGNEGQGARGGQGFDAASLIGRIDQNGDGAVSLEEAPERMKARFDQIDADGSGTVTAEELSSALGNMRRGGQGGKGAGKERRRR